MKWIYIEEISRHVGEEVVIKGWLYHKRSSGKIHFLLVRDGTGLLQGIVSQKEVGPEVFAQCEELTQESSVIVTGKVRADARAPGGYELDVSHVQPVQIAQGYPITPKEHGTAFLMDHRHLWLRSSRQHAILRIRSAVIKALRDFFDEQGFILFDSPILTPAACEGTSTLFGTEYLDGSMAYLSQSGQLYGEAGAMAFGKIYCFGPTFRAEKSKTRRHLSEFWMIEPEIAYADLDTIMGLCEEMLEYLVGQILETRARELETLERDLEPLKKIRAPFPRISYDEAVERLRQAGSDIPWGDDLGGDDETILAQMFDRPVMVHRYPAQCKAFYMKDDPENAGRVLCVDVLASEGYGEIIGGSQREDDLERLLEKIRQHNLPQEPFEWYLDLRRYGSVPHAGFGLGIERTVSWICGLSHVRETIPFPRTLYRLYP
ncbi:MAG: asparagine--tRNA ligase [Candidatus Tectomicrobia bacterium]|uniref:Asparagine--tRNA ligase n=1 Tax=Tectimicrobiota bacterium TaxID=2528274 RepID=A0A932CQL2_UNCTE|nr:asparagine--tRNA ligase [Candidatus Tectomicrobia bacterium]